MVEFVRFQRKTVTHTSRSDVLTKSLSASPSSTCAMALLIAKTATTRTLASALQVGFNHDIINENAAAYNAPTRKRAPKRPTFQ